MAAKKRKKRKKIRGEETTHDLVSFPSFFCAFCVFSRPFFSSMHRTSPVAPMVAITGNLADGPDFRACMALGKGHALSDDCHAR